MSHHLTFLKLGGSLITDKTRDACARLDVIRRMAREVKAALVAVPDLQLVLGHGSGSYGHVMAKRFNVHQGCTDWWGYAATGAMAARLNRLVVDVFLEERVPVVSFQPSASARCAGGKLLYLATGPVRGALAHGLVPVIHGDVSLDEEQGSAIVSTEQILAYLSGELDPARIVLAGEVDGVFTEDPLRAQDAERIPEIDRHNIRDIGGVLTGSHGVDVTGGMLSKVMTMFELARAYPNLSIHLISGRRQGEVYRALAGEPLEAGTLIHW